MADKKMKTSKQGGFQTLGLSKELLRGILGMGYKVKEAGSPRMVWPTHIPSPTPSTPI
jgi:hypothetical protein